MCVFEVDAEQFVGGDAEHLWALCSRNRRLARSDESERRGCRTVPRARNGAPALASCGEPRLLSLLNRGDGLLRRPTERGTRLEIRDGRDVAAVLVAVEDVDVIGVQSRSSRVKAYRSTSLRNWRIWYGFAWPWTSWRLMSSAMLGWQKMW